MSFSSNCIRVIHWYKDRNTISRGESWLPGVLLGDTESVFCKVLHGIGDTLLGPLSGEWAVEWPLSVAILSLSGELSSWRSLGWHFLKTRWGRADVEPVAALNSSASEVDVCMDVWHMGKAETVSENVNVRLTRRILFFSFKEFQYAVWIWHGFGSNIRVKRVPQHVSTKQHGLSLLRMENVAP